MTAGLIIAAPRSGSGKTVVTLGLLRHLHRKGRHVAVAKVGPDYIDPGFLSAACGTPCRNLDSWAMRRETLTAQISKLENAADLLLCEGVMGLFDGVGEAGLGSTADLAALTGWPVVLVVDGAGQAQSAGALVEGFAHHRADVTIAGVIFNRVGGERHAATLAAALEHALPEMKYLGAVPRAAELDLPRRHLGLVPAAEYRDLNTFIDEAAALVGSAVDGDALAALARPSVLQDMAGTSSLPRLGLRIAVARDEAFAFCYDTVLEDWHHDGATLSFFSPLQDEAPARDSDAVYLPGGYPELFAAQLAANRHFIGGLHDATRRGAAIYGECGGYMVLGRRLIDAEGTEHEMAGLLRLETNFAVRKLHLGYRTASLAVDSPFAAAGQIFRGHEFHYATVISEGDTPLFLIAGADGTPIGHAGQIAGRIMGSFIHLIDRA